MLKMFEQRWIVGFFIFLCFLLSPTHAKNAEDPASFSFEIEKADKPDVKYIEVDWVFHLQPGWKVQHPKDPNPLGVPPHVDTADSVNVERVQIDWPDEVQNFEDEDRVSLRIYPQSATDPVTLNMDVQFSICKEECRFFNERLTAVLPSLESYQQGNTSLQECSQGTVKTMLWHILLLAFLGGLILNVMPCVLPVLSLKLMQFSKHNDAHYRLYTCATILGIYVSFWVLSGCAVGLRSLGHEVGWGFHFQEPLFLLLMSGLMFVFALNLLGLFEIALPQGLYRVLHVRKQGFVSHFALGLLATLLATPCSAPFLGTAVTAALSSDLVLSLGIFTAMGTGFAVPYFVILVYPHFPHLLPKPGKWMVRVRQFMGLCLFGTGVWLGSIWYEVHIQKGQEQAHLEPGWEVFETSKIQQYVKEGLGVFVDVTARWCVTCVANKQLVLSRTSVKDVLHQSHIRRLRADWTLPSPVISKYLNSHQRFGIPFNVYYSPRCPKGHVFPEILDVQELMKVVKEIC